MNYQEQTLTQEKRSIIKNKEFNKKYQKYKLKQQEMNNC